jgi:hypothetical protein
MVYKKEELLKTALKAIEEKKLFFIEDVVSYLPCDKTTFYNHDLHENNAIKDALEKNKTEVKVSMRSKWYKSENATLQVALMKLISTDAEAHRLNGTRTENKTELSGKISLEVSENAKTTVEEILAE